MLESFRMATVTGCWDKYLTALPATVKSLHIRQRQRLLKESEGLTDKDWQKWRDNLRFGPLATVHTGDNDIRIVGLGNHPQGLFGGLFGLHFLLDELGAARLRVPVDLGLELFFDVLGLVLERQVLLFGVSDGAHVESVLLGSEEALHGNGEGEF